VKAVVEVDAQVALLRNERAEWELPGGRLEIGEELEAAAEREVQEELGLSVSCRALVDAWTYRPAGATGTVVVVVYDCELRCEDATMRTLTMSEEHSDARWFAVASLAAIEMPERYKRSIRRASSARRRLRNVHIA
jgi:8-oxo-dGTP pyrophosphatase MutT (NUDIX family)